MTALSVLYNTMILSNMKVAALEWILLSYKQTGEQHVPRSHATSVIMAITVLCTTVVFFESFFFLRYRAYTMDNKMSFIACMFLSYVIHCTFNSCTKQNDLPCVDRAL